MRNFNAAFIAKLRAETAFFIYMLEFQLSNNYYYNSADIDFYYAGNNYVAIPLGFTDIRLSSAMTVDRVSIEIGNANLIMSATLLGEDVRSKVAVVSMAAVNDNNKIIAAENFFTGMIDAWSINEDKVSIEIVNELIFWNKKVLRPQTQSCSWNFVNDGTGECAYSGSNTWCDKSFERCVSLENSAHFGGFRFAPAVAEKQLWWGKTPK